MKKIMLGMVVFICFSQIVHCMDLDNFMMISGGRDSAELSLALNIAKGVPKFEEIIKKDTFSVVINGADWKDLGFISMYATLRSGVKQDAEKYKENEALVEKIITGMTLEQLAHKTVMIGQLYNESVPEGFDVAWQYQLNDNKVGKGIVEELIENENVVNAIYEFFQDQSKPMQRSTVEDTIQQNNPVPIFLPQSELDALQKQIAQDKKDDEDNKGEKPSSSGFAAFKSAISERWSQMQRLKKWVIGGGFSAIVLFALYKAIHRG